MFEQSNNNENARHLSFKNDNKNLSRNLKRNVWNEVETWPRLGAVRTLGRVSGRDSSSGKEAIGSGPTEASTGSSGQEAVPQRCQRGWRAGTGSEAETEAAGGHGRRGDEQRSAEWDRRRRGKCVDKGQFFDFCLWAISFEWHFFWAIFPLFRWYFII